jgi:uncharacterized protein (UPF0335 family)
MFRSVQRAMVLAVETQSMTENNQIKSIVERIERLEAEKQAIADDVKEVYAEAKGNGFDPKILKKVIALRKLDPEERERMNLMIETYMTAL